MWLEIVRSTDVKIPPWDSLEPRREVFFYQGYNALTQLFSALVERFKAVGEPS